MEDDRGLIRVLEEQLVENIEDDRHQQEAPDRDTDLRGQAELREPRGQRTPEILDKTHSGEEERKE
jgi:hypothetical protein